MVAYSYKPRFIVPILVGLGLLTKGGRAAAVNGFEISTFVRMNLPQSKRQTIRAIGKRRHARPGDALQHYTGMRTKNCRLIGRSTCESARPIAIKICNDGDLLVSIERQRLSDSKAEIFARDDGFGSIEDMWLFWRENHPGVTDFGGVVIGWVQ